MISRTLIFLLCISFCPAPLLAQVGAPEPAHPLLAEATAQAAERAHRVNLERYKGDADWLVLPGLLANRADKTVRLWARATSIGHGDPVEFLIIPQDSGKDYEAVAVSFARPSDVHRALEFIGLKPGRPVNYLANQYWPRGERVVATFEWADAGPADKPHDKPEPRRVRGERIIFDIRAGKPLPETGFVFVGSHRITVPDSGKDIYAADVSDSKSILSDYNERSTVLDVPRQAPQGAVYGSLKLNPECHFVSGQPVSIILSPLHRDLKPRVIDLSLKASIPGGANPQAGVYTLLDSKGQPAADGRTLVHVLASFGKLAEEGFDPFVAISVDEATTLDSLNAFYKLVAGLDKAEGIRVDAPPDGHLYYRAFFANPEWRDRSKRLGRPWELHLIEKDRQVAGTLILPADEFNDNDGKGDLKFTVGSAEETAKVLAEQSDRFSQSVYVFAPNTMTYGQLMAFIRPAMKTHPAVYVFLPQAT